ncbi:signal transduction histidine kinase/ligand-binding sensor domain-containing protein/CheY-like chemotaxis protein [Catalinimonas alkaloidigena]|uniref:hybrid sensor histidine kinase/response regulator n=1 Tax=Catalinimonas alkaloidigena TaxID=1075417 RepID=UPI002405DD01|nr:hybrid sensor histidine kinase/response regulator [Catalinimonas alkaloidigena]MDF9801183.1 signal transduction histidine kinase/ligand-binding sensor domain-containing protein/CheY-like chemotaxis protein [Catalinimonas alkaloidigena]
MKFSICLLFSLLQLPLLLSAQYKSIKFEEVRANQGISSNVICILQDSRGFMWFGTRDGLSKYDGYNLTNYKHDYKDAGSISHSTVMDLIEDEQGNLWVATWDGGLNKHDRYKDRFESYQANEEDPEALASNMINSILIDSQGNFWVCTKGGGLNLFDRESGSFTHYRHQSENISSISSDMVTEVYEDSEQNLWVGTYDGGLNLFNRKAQTFTRFQYDKRDPQSLSHNYISEIYEDSQNRLWVCTRGGGLNLLDRKTQKFRHFRHSPYDQTSIASDVILSIEEDDQGVLWIGTENGGISILENGTEIFQNYKEDGGDDTSLGNNTIYDIYKDNKDNIWVGTFSSGLHMVNIDYKQFAHYKHNSSPYSLSNNNVLCIYEDSSNDLWVGTDGGGLNLFDREEGRFYHYKHELGNKNSIAGNHVLRVTEDSEGNLWIGTWGDGLTIYNKERNTYRHFNHDPDNPQSINSDNIWNIYEDSQKNIWLATYHSGLDLYDRRKDAFVHFTSKPEDKSSIGHNTVNNIFEDSHGRLWVGTKGGGLNLMDRKTNTFTRFVHHKNKNSISNNFTSCIFEDKRGDLWIGTEEGLNRLNNETNKFTNYFQVDGLPNDFIFGILEDDHGNLWISTKKGLSKYDPLNDNFENYGVADGLQAEEYREAYCKSRSGKMYFGGINGLNEFHPDSIKEKEFTPPLVITKFEIFNSVVPIGQDDEAILKKHISETEALTLSHEHSVFSFEFASLNYTLPDKKQYAYQLEGFDKSWNYVGTQHMATYTNLDPGTYTFRVKGLDNQGSWSKNTASLKLTITPPYWQTWWFRLGAVLFILGGFVLSFHVRVRVIHNQKEALERQVKERTEQLESLTEEERIARLEAEKARVEAEKANRAKSVFLATMSHEIRTPMNGVMGMTALLEETALSHEQQEYTATIRSSSENLLGVINDILDFSKIESGKMELEARDFHLRSCVEGVLDLFATKVNKNEMNLVLQVENAIPTQVRGDALRLRQILMNLVGNAVKFTDKGEVFVLVRLLNQKEKALELEFEVRDSGIGIPKEKIERLFKSFSQVDSSTTRKYGGSGLGLAICKKLIEMMGGQIQVQSEEGVGSTFTFNICLQSSLQNQPDTFCELSSMQGKRVLIADENASLREVLRKQLSDWKLIPVAVESVEQALKTLSEADAFDLLMIDTQMAEIHRDELIVQLNDTYNLPVIFMNVAGMNHQWSIEGCATSMISKPIRQQLLYEHLRKIFEPDQTQIKHKPDPKKLSDRLAQEYPLNILVAEDNLVNQKLAIRILEKLGYHPDLAKNGKEAVAAAQNKHYDIILMDVEMPELDGMEATRQIRETSSHQPVIIALTANAMQGDKESCLNAQMDDYLHKPFKLTQLSDTLKHWAVERRIRKEFACKRLDLKADSVFIFYKKLPTD